MISHIITAGLLFVLFSAVATRIGLFKRASWILGLLYGLAASVPCIVFHPDILAVTVFFLGNAILFSMLHHGISAGCTAAVVCFATWISVSLCNPTVDPKMAWIVLLFLSVHVFLAILFHLVEFHRQRPAAIHYLGVLFFTYVLSVLTVSILAGFYLPVIPIQDNYRFATLFLPVCIFISSHICAPRFKRQKQTSFLAPAMYLAYFAIMASICFFTFVHLKQTSYVLLNEELEWLTSECTFQMSQHLYTTGLQLKNALPTAQAIPTAAELDKTATRFSLSEITYVSKSGELQVSTRSDFANADAFQKTRGLRYRQLLYLHADHCCEHIFSSVATPDGQPVVYNYFSQPDNKGYVFFSMAKSYFDTHVEAFGLPEIHEMNIGSYAFFVILKTNDASILAIDKKHENLWGNRLEQTSNLPDNFKTGGLATISIGDESVHAIMMTCGPLRYLACIPQWRLVQKTAMATHFIGALLALVCVLARVLLRMTQKTREHLEQERQKELDRHASDMATAKALQLSVLPTHFPPSAWDSSIDLYASMSPALEVGGDFYNFYYLTPTRLLFLVADVSGKGIAGAMFMMKAKSILQNCISSNQPLDDSVAEANKMIDADNAQGMFVTSWIGVLDTENGNLEYVNAGHNAPYIRHADGSVQCLDAVSGLFLGGMPDTEYTLFQTRLFPGDTLLVYSDGITEAVTKGDVQYGEERLENLLKGFQASSDAAVAQGIPKALCNEVTSSVSSFSQGFSQFDDMTLLALHYRGAVKEKSLTIQSNLDELAKLSAFLEENLKAYPCSEDDFSMFMIALDEIGANIISYSGSPQFTMKLSITEAPRCATLEFIDSGRPYNPLLRPPPDLTLDDMDRPIGGLGIFVIKETMDTLDYRYVNNQNHLLIQKRLTL